MSNTNLSNYPPLERYVEEEKKLNKFFSYVVDIAEDYDKTYQRLAEVLKTDAPSKHDKLLAEWEKDGKGAKRGLTEQRQLVFELIYVRVVDNFLIFLSDILQDVYKLNPELISSSEEKQIGVSRLFEYKELSTLIDVLIEEEVNRLSFKGLHKLQAHVKTRLKLKLFAKSKINEAIRIIEIRNILVHNRGIINKRFIERVPALKDKIGQSINLERDDMFAKDLSFLDESVVDITKRVNSKYKLF